LRHTLRTLLAQDIEECDIGLEMRCHDKCPMNVAGIHY
jgi:hypothetical protein